MSNKILWTLFSILFLLLAQSGLYAQEHYIMLKERDRSVINERITRIISIHKIEGENIFAFANEQELSKIRAYGYVPELLKHASEGYRNLDMATTPDQMANWNRYPTYEVYRAMMKRFEAQFPEFCRLDSIGTTNKGRKLYVLKITNQVDQTLPKPEMFYTSSMHGNETTGFVLLLRLADYLLQNYGSDSRITKMLNETVIYINPAANPDGTYKSGNHTVAGATRGNANGKDINRNFPDPRVGAYPTGPYQVETIAMMDFAQSKNLSLSANFHDGAELVNYPWDAWVSDERKHADHNWLEAISIHWADQVHAVGPQGYFSPGYTHGGDWYVVAGGRQDYMNYWHHCREVTLELHEEFLTATELLPAFWNYQKESLLSYIEWLQTGISGTVKNEAGISLEAKITVLNHDKDESWVRSNPYHGFYSRQIEPGTWQLEFSAYGYIPQVHEVNIESIDSSNTLDVVLKKAQSTRILGQVVDAVTGQRLGAASVRLNDSPYEAIYTDTSGWFRLDSVTIGTYELRVARDGYITGLQTIVLDTTEAVVSVLLFQADPEDFETGISEGLEMNALPWERVADESFEGTYSLKSGVTANYNKSIVDIKLDISVKGEISFALKTSSEESYDFLKFSLDGEEMGAWSGEIDWLEVSYPVDTGLHTFEWIYVKDQSDTGGSDCAWIDRIIFPQSNQAVEFNVYSDPDGLPLENVLIDFNSRSQHTDATGKTIFQGVYRGKEIPFAASGDGFSEYADMVDVRFVDVEQSIYLKEQISDFSVSFHVLGGGLNVTGAEVNLGADTLWTDAEGMVVFDAVDPGYYPYSVLANGFVPVDGEMEVIGDTLVEFLMTPVSAGSVKSGELKVVVLSNPFGDELELFIEQEIPHELLIELFDSNGRKVLETKRLPVDGQGAQFVLNGLEGLQNGIYYLRVKAGEARVVRRLVKVE